MTKEQVCKMVCENIIDEHKAQPEYMKMVEQLKKDNYPNEAEAIKSLIVTDEKKHENYLKILNQSHECRCPGVVYVPKVVK